MQQIFVGKLEAESKETPKFGKGIKRRNGNPRAQREEIEDYSWDGFDELYAIYQSSLLS